MPLLSRYTRQPPQLDMLHARYHTTRVVACQRRCLEFEMKSIRIIKMVESDRAPLRNSKLRLPPHLSATKRLGNQNIGLRKGTASRIYHRHL